MTRHEHWDTRHLHPFLIEAEKRPFQWGVSDCCLIAADAIEAMTGVDIAEDFRGKYTTELGAFKLIREITGGTTVADAAAYCAQTHDLVEWPSPLYARRGDLVVIEDDGNLIAGFVHLNGRHAISIGQDGLKRLPLSAVKRAWHVG